MKKYLILLFIFMLMPIVSAKAAYKQDLIIERPFVRNTDGTALMSVFKDNRSKIFDETIISGKSVTVRRGSDTLKMTIGETAAEFNSQEITLPHAPFRYKVNSDAYIPARFVCELFGIRIKYEDLLNYRYPYNDIRHSGQIVLLSGEDIHEISGLIGDSYNGWTIDIPDGFICYTDSVDSNAVIFDNLYDISVKVELWQPTSDDVISQSFNTDSYLVRNEAVQGAKNKFYVQGLVYSQPTDENRALLNSIMDTFKPYYIDSAQDISNNKGGAWDYCNTGSGVSFDMPLSWDTYNQNGIIIDAGYNYEPQTKMKSEFYMDLEPEQYVNDYIRYREYYDLDPQLSFTENEYGGRSFFMAEELTDDGSENPKMSVHAVAGSGGNTHHFIFSRSISSDNSSTAINEEKGQLYTYINQVLSTMKFSEPKLEGNTFHPVGDASETNEVTINGLKFDVPEFICADYTKYVISYVIKGRENSPTDILNSISIIMDTHLYQDGEEIPDGYREEYTNDIKLLVSDDELIYYIPGYDMLFRIETFGSGSEEYMKDLHDIIYSAHL